MNTALTIAAVGALGLAAFSIYESRLANPTDLPLPDDDDGEQERRAEQYKKSDSCKSTVWSADDCETLIRPGADRTKNAIAGMSTYASVPLKHRPEFQHYAQKLGYFTYEAYLEAGNEALQYCTDPLQGNCIHSELLNDL